MTPDQLRASQLAAVASGSGVGKIAPEMKDLLVKQAAEKAAAQTASDIDAHNARIELQERHAEEAKTLASTLAPHEKHEKHEKHHKGKGK